MADQSGRPALKAAFPTPPPFYKYFTADNLSKARDSAQERPRDDDGDSLQDFEYCLPPPPPGDGKYLSFGAQHDLAQPELSLADVGITQLYPSAATTATEGDTESGASLDPSPHLLSLSRSILLNFLELLGILSVDPSQHAEKIEHIQTIYFNIHHLINQYRPHQARESLILMMEDQVKRHRAHIAAINEAEKKTEDMISSIQQAGRSAGTNSEDFLSVSSKSASNDDSTKWESTQRRAQSLQWANLDRELG